MIWDQTFIELKPQSRGFHLVTNEILAQAPALQNCQVGLLHLLSNTRPPPWPLTRTPTRTCAAIWSAISM